MIIQEAHIQVQLSQLQLSEQLDQSSFQKFDIQIKASSTVDIVQVELEIDGVKKRTFDAPPFKESVNLTDGVHTLRAKAKDSNGKESDRIITIGVNVAWDSAPTP